MTKRAIFLGFLWNLCHGDSDWSKMVVPDQFKSGRRVSGAKCRNMTVYATSVAQLRARRVILISTSMTD